MSSGEAARKEIPRYRPGSILVALALLFPLAVSASPRTAETDTVWLAHPASFISEVVNTLERTPLSSPEGARRDQCWNFQSGGYEAGGADYWVSTCSGSVAGQEWREYYFDLGGDTRPTLERLDWIARARNSPSGWTALMDGLVDTLVTRGATIESRSRYELTALSELAWRGAGLSIELYFEPSRPSTRRVTVTLLSPRLLGAMSRGELTEAYSNGQSDLPVSPPWAELVRTVRAEWPDLGAAMGRGPRMLSSDIRFVYATAREAYRTSRGTERHDLALLGANSWCETFAQQRESGDSAAVDSFNYALGVLGARIGNDFTGWCYNEGFRNDLIVRAGGSSRWADIAFLEAMEEGFGSPCEWDENGAIVTVLAHGDAFLREHSKADIAPDVRRMLAQAHETAWCVASSDLPEAYYSHVADFRAAADTHRNEALRLYDEYLRERPDDPRNKAIRVRMRRIRQGIDTAYYKYWFSGD